MAIIKQAKNIIIKVGGDSTIFVKENLSKETGKLVLKTTEGDIVMYAAKRLKAKNNGD